MKASRDMYHFYKKTAKGEKLKETEYCKINNEFNKLLMKKIQEGHTVTFPCGMGRLLIQGKKERLIVSPNGKMRGLAPDWKSTKLLADSSPEAKAKRQLVYFINDRTGGYRYRYEWERGAGANKILYTFKPVRMNKRKASKSILSNVQFITYN